MPLRLRRALCLGHTGPSLIMGRSLWEGWSLSLQRDSLS